MLAYRGLGLYSHGQDCIPTIFSLFEAIFSPFAAILETFIFFVLGPLVGPLCSAGCTVGPKRKSCQWQAGTTFTLVINLNSELLAGLPCSNPVMQ